MELLLSTIGADAPALARSSGLGLEIATFCTAWNMDDGFAQADALVRRQIAHIRPLVLHAPFNELFPCAIDPKARALAAQRYRQAIALAGRYGAKKVVIHGGFHPQMYYPVWYVEQSILFWREFLQQAPGVTLVLENVLEDTPDMLAEIMQGVDHPALRLCLDVGHVNAYSRVPIHRWMDRLAPWLDHFHLHNNDASGDCHAPLQEGSLPMEALLRAICDRFPAATATLELPEPRSSLDWLKETGLLPLL